MNVSNNPPRRSKERVIGFDSHRMVAADIHLTLAVAFLFVRAGDITLRFSRVAERSGRPIRLQTFVVRSCSSSIEPVYVCVLYKSPIYDIVLESDTANTRTGPYRSSEQGDYRRVWFSNGDVIERQIPQLGCIS